MTEPTTIARTPSDAHTAPPSDVPPSDGMTRRTDDGPTRSTQDGRGLRLLVAAFAVTFLFDRLVVATWTDMPAWVYQWGYLTPLAVFWLVCLAVMTALHPHTALTRPLTWTVTLAVVALAAWCMLAETRFQGNLEFELITVILVMPALLMLHAQLANGLYDVRRPLGVVVNWFAGWVVKPFTRIGRLFRLLDGLGRNLRGCGPDGTRRIGGAARKAGLAMLIGLPLLAVLLALLSGADMVFRYGLTRLFGDFDVRSLCTHAAWTLLPLPFLFSLLAHADDTSDKAKASYAMRAGLRFDGAVTAIVLGMALAAYAVFCGVQFTFLFAGAGLPDGLTYAEYARSGFFQLLAVAAINLTMFGLAHTYARRTRTLVVMLVGLVGATGVMLASAARRLLLYIAAYGLTWMRYAAGAFIGLLAVMLLLALVKMVLPRLPLTAACLVAFLVWYVAFGWSDPAYVIGTFDAAHGFGMGPTIIP
ncbi:DUF4173 domain-containing protein [Bifidobacterium sp. CP2]|uniref:DUF4153 domain-containing protein n=1 Tax=Bifidobacterium sp. CP2 TaxID=2809025 RepID=UPI001BDC7D39|nr:DUF4173 domain-containing protein [Bifidobacterium sp. CP2]MBT1182201.1 DUF4173 domain-containing protein [Bifidobacterium sp. CP2]